MGFAPAGWAAGASADVAHMSHVLIELLRRSTEWQLDGDHPESKQSNVCVACVFGGARACVCVCVCACN